MQTFIWTSMMALTLIVLIAILVVIVRLRKSNLDSGLAEQGMHPKGFWVSTGISIGVGFGVALGLMFDNLALGIPIGATIGAGIGAAFERQNQNKIRPLTEQELKLQKWGVIAGLLILLLFAGIFTFLLVLANR
jgi:hypothetical protein